MLLSNLITELLMNLLGYVAEHKFGLEREALNSQPWVQHRFGVALINVLF